MRSTLVLKWVCCTGVEAFKGRPILVVAVAFVAYNNFIVLLKNFIASMLKRKVHLKAKYNYYVAMRSLVMSFCSGDLLKMEIKVFTVLVNNHCSIHWFLDS